MLAVVVEFTLRAESYPAFVERVKQQAKDSLELEADCHQFDVCIDPERKDFVLLYELYSDRQAFDAHLQSAHFADFSDTVADWISERKLDTYTPDLAPSTDTGEASDIRRYG